MTLEMCSLLLIVIAFFLSNWFNPESSRFWLREAIARRRVLEMERRCKSGNRIIDLIKQGKAEIAIKALSEEHKVQPPKLRELRRETWVLYSGGYYDNSRRLIIVSDVTKAGVILHEFAHHLQSLVKLHVGEFEACDFASRYLSSEQELENASLATSRKVVLAGWKDYKLRVLRFFDYAWSLTFHVA